MDKKSKMTSNKKSIQTNTDDKKEKSKSDEVEQLK